MTLDDVELRHVAGHVVLMWRRGGYESQHRDWSPYGPTHTTVIVELTAASAQAIGLPSEREQGG